MGKNNILIDLFSRKYNQRKNAQKLKIDKINSIDEGLYVRIGGIDQWITIRGEDVNNPVLLFVHGGPGSTYSIFKSLLRSWEKCFTIVQWDQRGAGKTFKKNGREGCGRITLQQLAKDGIELSEYLCKRLQQEKLILIGSSIGSLIGVMMAKSSPDLFYAYVGTDQNAPDTEFISYELVIDALISAGDKKGVEHIKKMGPDPSKWNKEDYVKRDQYIVKATKNVPNMIMDLMIPNMLSSPDHKISDIIDIFKGMNFSRDEMYEELMSNNLEKLGMNFETPFFIFQGDSDIITPTAVAKAYFDKGEAPYKEFVLIKNAGHLACFARKDQFLEELINRVLPVIILSKTK